MFRGVAGAGRLYVIKNQLGHSFQSHTLGCHYLVLYGISKSIIEPFRVRKLNIPYALKNQRGASKRPHTGSLMHKTFGASNTLKLWTNESRASLELDQ